jgi:transposase
MENIRLTFGKSVRRELGKMLAEAEKKGDLRGAKRIMAVFGISEGLPYDAVASAPDIEEKTIKRRVETLLLKGPAGLKSRKPPGRKPKLTKSQKKELSAIISRGPAKAGFPGNCWRSPVIQTLIYKKFGVFYAVNYISGLLKNMGFSYQKACSVSSRRDRDARREWLKTVWPEILKTAEQKNALILYGDEASFPQRGTLSYTWAKKGCQPAVKTSGSRKSYKVFGLIEYFSGRFFYKAHEGRLNSESYAAFLKGVLKKTSRHLILIQDRARYHTSGTMREFFRKHAARLTVYELPSYSPDYNPIEMLWKKIKEKETHLHYFPTFASLKRKVNQALVRFEDMRDEVLRLFGLYNRQPRKKSAGLAINININVKIEIKKMATA